MYVHLHIIIYTISRVFFFYSMACACVRSRAPPHAQQMVSLKDMKTVKKARPWESTGAPCCVYCLESLVWGAKTKLVSGTVLDNIIRVKTGMFDELRSCVDKRT